MTNEDAMIDIIKSFKRNSTESIAMDLIKEVRGTFSPLPKYVADLIDELRKLNLKDEVISVILYQSVYIANHEFNIKDTINNRQFVKDTIEMGRRWVHQYGKIETVEEAIHIAEHASTAEDVPHKLQTQPQVEEKVALEFKLDQQTYEMLRNIAVYYGHQSYEQSVTVAINRLYTQLRDAQQKNR
ncbi:hypothetical protein FZC66_12785 [Priestia megaterium]|nr:hypothetical protein FZC66_12785 [Priestia megaterium]